MIRFILNDRETEAASGTTVLEAARVAGCPPPTLCHSPHLTPTGACRLCLVEVEGGRPVAACRTPVVEGAVYRTHSEALTEYRRTMVGLMVASHPLDCETCAADGDCELQEVVAEVGLPDKPLGLASARDTIPDTRHPFLTIDPAKCIACARCVRACDEVQGSFVLGMAGRGERVRAGTYLDLPLDEANCASCGQCAAECPTGAIREADTWTRHDKATTTTCVYCAVGCSLTAYVRDGCLTRMRPAEGSANRGHACVKGRFGSGFVHSEERLKTPLIRGADGEFREASWDEALDLIAERLAPIKGTAFGLMSSSRCTNEENFVAQKFTRVVMGSNSVDNCARVCHSPSAFALGAALGTGAGTSSFEDIERSDLLLVVGANPTEAHPVLGARIKQAVFKGCKLIVVDPRNTELARLADVHIPLRPGSNTAVINAMQQVLMEENLIDRDFIADHAENFAALEQSLLGKTPEWAEPLSGVPAGTIREAARLYGKATRAQILWGLGITESCHGTIAAFGLINMAVMCGNVGRPGTGCGPIRGQNNVQGACDMGALPNVFSDYRPVDDPTARAEHEKVWGSLPPRQPGFKAPEMFEAARAKALKAMIIIAQDPAQSDPDGRGVAAALESLEFLVVQDIFLSETARFAHVVLPGSSFLEKEGTFVNSDRRVQRVRRALPPLAGYTDGDTLNELARRMGHDFGFGFPLKPKKVMEEIVRLTPKWGGITYERLEKEGFLQWPCPDENHPGTALVHEGGNFLRGKARLTPTPWRPPGEEVNGDYPFLLTTGRILFHYNVGTMTRRTDIARLARAKEETLRIHPDDAERLGFDSGDMVQVVSRHGQVTAPVEVTNDTRPGLLFMTFHFPETRTNLLIAPDADEHTRCPEYKVTAVRIERG